MTRLIALSLPALFAAACAADPAPAGEAARGPLGKADMVGSCADTDCEGAAPGGNCWCDDQCAEYGDCCADKVEVCEAPVSPTCGGFVGVTCGSDEMYCHYQQEDNCGAVDMIGTCREVPGACIEVFMPVCGCDGETYSNSCFAAMAGTSVLHDGACEEPAAEACGGRLGLACNEGDYCHYEEADMCGAADHLGTCRPMPQACTQEFAPVCGCDGETHSNACQAAMSGTSVVHQGACE